MPKLKTRKSLQHRFRVTGTGKIMRSKIGKSHLRRNKSKRTLRTYSQSIKLDPVDQKRMKKVFPAGLR
jgi:large subunit ribosomal protein L35